MYWWTTPIFEFLTRSRMNEANNKEKQLCFSHSCLGFTPKYWKDNHKNRTEIRWLQIWSFWCFLTVFRILSLTGLYKDSKENSFKLVDWKIQTETRHIMNDGNYERTISNQKMAYKGSCHRNLLIFQVIQVQDASESLSHKHQDGIKVVQKFAVAMAIWLVRLLRHQRFRLLWIQFILFIDICLATFVFYFRS